MRVAYNINNCCENIFNALRCHEFRSMRELYFLVAISENFKKKSKNIFFESQKSLKESSTLKLDWISRQGQSRLDRFREGRKSFQKKEQKENTRKIWKNDKEEIRAKQEQ